MRILNEFREFAVKGNVIDLAVGVIIGSAFGKIVASLVNDIVMPPIGILLGGVNFKDLKLILKEAVITNSGEILTESVTVNYGMFAQNLFDFFLIAFVIFIAIQAINAMKKKEVETPTATPKPLKSEILLEEIRDLLKKK